MITGLDHIAIAVRDFEATVDAYCRLFGREPDLEPGDGAHRAWFRFPNMAFEIIAPGDDHPGHQVRKRLDEAGEGQWLAAFQVDDVAGSTRLLERRGLAVEPMGTLSRVQAAGLHFLLWPRRAPTTSPATGDEAAAVSELDHVVVQTSNADRAVGIYGAKFGMDLRLDRSNEQWGVRQLFFRCGSAVFEVAASLKTAPTDSPDSFGGLAWRVSDPEAARARMIAEGFNVSEVRTGRKPGTKVFTVRDAPGACRP